MKKLISLLSALVLGTFLFAEQSSVGLTDSDVLNFIDNYTALNRTIGMLKAESQIEIFLENFGISGPDRVKKYAVLNEGASLIYAESKKVPSIKTEINSKDLAVIKKYSKQIVECLKDNEEIESLTSSMNKRQNKSSSLLSAEKRAQLLAQQEEAFKQQQLEYEKANAKRQPQEGSIYLSTVENKIKSSKKNTDCGLLYKKYDSKNAAYYKKAAKSKVPFSTHKVWKTSDGKDEAMFTIDSESITLEYIDDDGEDVEKTIQLTVTQIEFFYTQKTGKEKYYANGTGGEFILTTKEAGIIHIWYDNAYGASTGSQNVKVWIEALGELNFSDFVHYVG